MSSAAKTASESNTSNAGPEAANDPGVDPRLLEILVCPVTRSALTYDREANELVSRAAGLRRPRPLHPTRAPRPRGMFAA